MDTLYALVTWNAGSSLDELHRQMQSCGLALLRKHGLSVQGCWVPDGANPRGRLVCLLAAPSRFAYDAAWRALGLDGEWARHISPALDAPSVLMALTSYSPHLQQQALAGGRVFEFRTYEAAPGRLSELNARFRDHTLRLFERHALHNLGYWNLLPGQEGSDTTLFYMLWHRDRATGEAGLQRFMADPEWKVALEASQVNGKLVAPPPRGVRSEFHLATAYSPLR